jgi:iron complex outermembrane receptor protein
MKYSHEFKLRLSTLVITMVSVGLLSNPAYSQQTTEVGQVVIAGEGDKLGTGLMIADDGFFQKSTVTKTAIEKMLPSANVADILRLQPGVNSYSTDPTGLFGGNIRVRGFNSDQMGFTINGAPVNDSGNFAIYPQEYVDSENLCEVYVRQGSVDTEAPHIGASGGNIGIVSCAPKDSAGGKMSQSVGQYGYSRTFIRMDSGYLGESSPYKFYLSTSYSQANQFIGYGQAKREHVETGWDWKISSDTNLNGNILFNRAVNNNLATLTKAQYNNNPNMTYTNRIPQHNVGGSDAVNFSNQATPTSLGNTYYGYALNPFDNVLASGKLQTRPIEKLTLVAEPYYWYGYGTGGIEQRTLTTSSNFNGSANNGGISNPYSNSSSVVGVYGGSVTKTNRPGVTVRADYDFDDNKASVGYWVERASHQQTQPATTVTNQGDISSLWLTDGLVTYNNGSIYQGRNWLTTTTSSSLFAQNTWTVNKELDLNFGIRSLIINRNLNNYANNGTGGGATYSASASYSKVLPSLGARYRLNDNYQVYAAFSQNMKAPSNSVLTGWVSNVTYTNGIASSYTLNPNTSVVAETSTTYEGGLRYFGDNFDSSLAIFATNLNNRIASAYNPNTVTVTDYNVGISQVNGVEFQLGSKPIKGWSGFLSGSLTNSTIQSDMTTTTTTGQKTTLATAGKVFPDTPKYMFGASAQYTHGPYLIGLNAKYTGMVYTTLVNDESLNPYTVVNLNAGYQFEPTSFLKTPTIKLNIGNLLSAKYLLANSGSGSSITPTTNTSIRNGGSPSYYRGAYQFVGITISSDF